MLEPLPVVIPYADKLTFPTAWMRTRRDHARFLNLIEVSAFLHQYQRERRGRARSWRVLADYAIAYALAGVRPGRHPVRPQSAAQEGSHERIQTLAEKQGGTVSRREIREALSLPDTTVRRWLAELVELDYLAVAEGGGQGKAARYRTTTKGPQKDVVLGLLRPEELGKVIS